MERDVAIADEEPNPVSDSDGKIGLPVSVEIGCHEPDLQPRVERKRLLLRKGERAVPVSSEYDDHGVSVARSRNVETAVVIEVCHGHVVPKARHRKCRQPCERAVTQSAVGRDELSPGYEQILTTVTVEVARSQSGDRVVVRRRVVDDLLRAEGAVAASQADDDRAEVTHGDVRPAVSVEVRGDDHRRLDAARPGDGAVEIQTRCGAVDDPTDLADDRHIRDAVTVEVSRDPSSRAQCRVGVVGRDRRKVREEPLLDACAQRGTRADEYKKER